MSITFAEQLNIISETYGIPFLVLDAKGALKDSYSLLSPNSERLFQFFHFRERFLELWEKDKEPKIVSSELNQVWAGVPIFKEEELDLIIVIGPVFLSDSSKELIIDYAYSYDITGQRREQLLSSLNQTVVCSYLEFARLVAISYGMAYKCPLDISTLTMIRLNDQGSLPFNELNWDEKNISQDSDDLNPSALFEQNLLDSIREGNLGKLKRLLMTSNYARLPQFLATDKIRAHKNNFIGLLFLVTRMATEGGLNWALSYSLNEQYAQQAESLRDVSAILNLTREMLYDYTARVGNLRLVSQYSRRVNDCCNYIHEHLDENLKVSDLAEYSGFSPNYIARVFKKETGLSITDYIRQAKIDEAKTLLKYSSLSLSEISHQLSFSSQSFFTATFHRIVGLTPLQYRDSSSDIE